MLVNQIELGDLVYLAEAEDSKYQYGFRLLGPHKAAGAQVDDKVQNCILCSLACRQHACVHLIHDVLSDRLARLMQKDGQPLTSYSHHPATDVLLASA